MSSQSQSPSRRNRDGILSAHFLRSAAGLAHRGEAERPIERPVIMVCSGGPVGFHVAQRRVENTPLPYKIAHATAKSPARCTAGSPASSTRRDASARAVVREKFAI